MTTATVDLRAEAAAEVRRLARARVLSRAGDEHVLAQLEGDATWVLLARRTGLKRALGRRVCLVWRVAFEDRSGRIVESRLVPVLIDVGRIAFEPMPKRRASIRTLLHRSDGLVRARVEAECAEWRTAVARVASAFSSARQRREHDVAGQPPSSGASSQPGLFDRRAERSRLTHLAKIVESEQAAGERLRAAADAGAIALQRARLLLVLVP